jgi:adenylate cyclase
MIDMVRVKGKLEPVKIFELVSEGEPAPERKKAIDSFAEALELYQDKKFVDAEKIIKELEAQKESNLYKMYLDRIETFKHTPPPEDWDGVYTFTTK